MQNECSSHNNDFYYLSIQAIEIDRNTIIMFPSDALNKLLRWYMYQQNLLSRQMFKFKYFLKTSCDITED